MWRISTCVVLAFFLGCVGSSKQPEAQGDPPIRKVHFVKDPSDVWFQKPDGTPSEKQ